MKRSKYLLSCMSWILTSYGVRNWCFYFVVVVEQVCHWYLQNEMLKKVTCCYCIIIEISGARYSTRKVTDIDVILILLMFTEQNAGGAGRAVWCGWPGGAGHDRLEEKEVQQQQPLWAQCSAWHDTVSIQSPKSLFVCEVRFSQIIQKDILYLLSQLFLSCLPSLLSLYYPNSMWNWIFFQIWWRCPHHPDPQGQQCVGPDRGHARQCQHDRRWAGWEGQSRFSPDVLEIVEPLMWWCWFVLCLYLSLHTQHSIEQYKCSMHCCLTFCKIFSIRVKPERSIILYKVWSTDS